MRTYSFSVWDHELDGWEAVRVGVSLFGLRPLLREFRRLYGDCSLLVCCEQEWQPSVAFYTPRETVQ